MKTIPYEVMIILELMREQTLPIPKGCAFAVHSSIANELLEYVNDISVFRITHFKEGESFQFQGIPFVVSDSYSPDVKFPNSTNE